MYKNQLGSNEFIERYGIPRTIVPMIEYDTKRVQKKASTAERYIQQ